MPARMQDWYHSTFGYALVGAALVWLALPPLDLWPLAWIAPAWWVYLIRVGQLPPLPQGQPARSACERIGTGTSPHVFSPASDLVGTEPVPIFSQARARPLVLPILVAGLFLGWMSVNGLFLGRQYRMYWLAELFFWPVGFVLLLLAVRMAQRHLYVVLWLVGFSFWLAAVHWLRFPHWATGFGWLALSFYFAFYLPVFIAVSRAAVHRLRVPAILAAPIVWTALELARAHLLTGMTMASLGHTQYRWIELIQVSDLTGAFGVSFLVMFVAACLAQMAPCNGGRWALWPLLPAGGILAAALAYGSVRTAGEVGDTVGRIALIQGCIDTQMQNDEDLRPKIRRHYFDLSLQAVARYGNVDLVVWPESMFAGTWYTYDKDAAVPEPYSDRPAAEFRNDLGQAAWQSRREMVDLARAVGAPMLLGVDRQHFGPDAVRYYNTAAYVSPKGDLLGAYDKMHLVMFGEYVPFAWCLPWLQQLTPLSVSAATGDRPVAFSVGNLCAAPNICYETVLSHVIRDQVNTLRQQGHEPDVLINLTNDGWFWGSSELSMHLVCGVFRAVECRKPVLIAANTGISAWIDGNGRIRAQGSIHAPGVLLAEVYTDSRSSPYLRYGDWPSGICLAVSVLFVLAGAWGFIRKRGCRQARDPTIGGTACQ